MTKSMCLLRRFSAAVIVTIACIASGEAAEKLRYEEIPNRLAPFGTVLDYRGFRVITLDGKAHGGRRLRLESDHVRIFHLNNSYEDLASEQIARIEIRQRGRFFHHIVWSAEIPVMFAFLACGAASDNVSAARNPGCCPFLSGVGLYRSDYSFLPRRGWRRIPDPAESIRDHPLATQYRWRPPVDVYQKSSLFRPRLRAHRELSGSRFALLLSADAGPGVGDGRSLIVGAQKKGSFIPAAVP